MSTRAELDIDLLSTQAVDDPHRYFAPIREQAPVAWSARHRAWIITGHPELDDAFRNPLFSTERMAAFRSRLEGSRADALELAVQLLDGWMLFHEPPVHTRLRAPLSRSFTPRSVRSLEADVQRITDQLLDEMAAGPAEVDLVERFAHPLPAAVIAALMGVPPELGGWLREWSSRFGVVVFGATRRPDYEEVARAAGSEFHEHIGDLLEQRRSTPGDDLLSTLLQIENLPDGLTTTEIIGACSLLLFAGHDTTASLLGSATLALLDDPDAAAHLRSESVDLDLAMEELLRFEAPAKAMMRMAIEDHEFAGQPVRKGDAVFLTILAANRDARVFVDGDRLDLSRDPNPHLTFGHGHHFCLGAALARLEARIALPSLLRRFPDLAAAGPATWKPNISDRSAQQIPLRLR